MSNESAVRRMTQVGLQVKRVAEMSENLWRNCAL